ncbi:MULTISPECIES: hypothetical protein [unclassified Mameliella]|uniref:hypothetical protein n=1 Tax=unclassified Mameliella TaxID=2630630 RepID=UPI00273ECEB2|nr:MULTISPECIES: hypothetical protein [unclassified Mameliella]
MPLNSSNSPATEVEVLGTPGEDFRRGLPGLDTLIRGLGGEDKLLGQDGDDVLIPGPGGGPVRGGEGADTYVFTEARPTSMLDLKDFNLAEGDKLEFRGIFQGFEYEGEKNLAGHVSDYFGYLRLVKDGTLSRIEIDPTGSGTDFQAIAIIRNGRSLTLEDLFDAGAIRVTQTFPNVIGEGNDVPIFYPNSRSGADPEVLTVDGTGDLFINFVSSETSLDNVLGVYRIEDGEIGETRIFEDFEHSGPQSLDALFGGVDPGDQFGLFLVSDGQSDDALNSFAIGAPWDIYFGFDPGTGYQHDTLTWAPPCGPLGGPEGPVCPPGGTVMSEIHHAFDAPLNTDVWEVTVAAIGGYRGEQYLIGFEDYVGPESDFDFNDYVISVERSSSVPVDLSGETAGVIIDLEEQGYNYAAKVLPIGDSLTVGVGGSASGFRKPLFDALLEKGVFIDFVGEKPQTVKGVDLEHTGYTGRRLGLNPDNPDRSFILQTGLESGLDEQLKKFAPDVTL